MRKILLAFGLIVLALPCSAQEATLNTPVVRPSEAKQRVRNFNISAQGVPQATIEISVQDSTDNEIRYFNVVVPGCGPQTATVAGIFLALDTVRATENAGQLRRSNFRLLGYLFDQGCLPGVTLVP